MFEEPIGDVGFLKITFVEPATQSIKVNLTLPAFSYLSLLPILGKHAALMSLEMDPFKKVFTPPFDASDYHVQLSDHQVDSIKNLVSHKLNEYISLLNELRLLCDDPIKIMPLLPMGSSVKADFGCTVSECLELIKSLNEQETPMAQMVAGVLSGMLEKLCKAYAWVFQADLLLTE